MDLITEETTCRCGAYGGPNGTDRALHTHCEYCVNTTWTNGVCRRAGPDKLCPDRDFFLKLAASEAKTRTMKTIKCQACDMNQLDRDTKFVRRDDGALVLLCADSEACWYRSSIQLNQKYGTDFLAVNV